MPNTTTITHTIPEPWLSHLASRLAEIKSSREEELRHLGLAHEARERGRQQFESLGDIVRLIAREADLPDVAYEISADGSTIVSKSATSPAVLPAVPPSTSAA